jgi:imidazolonepropionase
VTSIAFTNIQTLVTNSSRHGTGLLGEINNCTLVVEDGVISQISSAIPQGVDQEIDCSGKTVIPGFVDSHSHLIFAGDRSAEFAARARGEKYSAAGITTTVSATRAASDEDLTRNVEKLLNEAISLGTTTIEIKSGYGLTTRDEKRSIEIAARYTDETTLLAAHVVPLEYRDNPDGYVKLIVNEMIPQTRAKWIDVFCDQGAFSDEQTRRILTAGKSAGMSARIHANQLSRSDAVAIAVEYDAASADHLGQSSTQDIEMLAASTTVATLLPGAEFSTQSHEKIGRQFLDAGVRVAIASDCNPGSSYTTSMSFCIAAAVNLLGFTVEEALNAATAGGAAALRRTDIGHLDQGARADFAILDAPSYIHLAYRPGVNLIEQTWKNGKRAHTWHK